jgi:hypothetical protein
MANPQPPIVVQAHGNAITSDCTFYLDAGCIVVVKTPFLHWVPSPAVGGGPPQAGLGTFQLLYAFGARLRSAAAPAVVAAVRGASPFTLRLSAAAWSRIFDELVLAGIFDSAGAIEDYDELQGLIESAIYPTPANLHIADADLALGQAFTLPNGNGAAAVRNRELLAQVRFVHLSTVALLEDVNARSPWKALTTLIACVGPCLTNASRMDETSHVQDFASLFRSRRPECTTDGALARALRTITSDVRLPHELRPATLSPTALAEAAMDGLNYQSMDRRPGIEERRVDVMVRKVRALLAPPLYTLINTRLCLAASGPHTPLPTRKRWAHQPTDLSPHTPLPTGQAVNTRLCPSGKRSTHASAHRASGQHTPLPIWQAVNTRLCPSGKRSTHASAHLASGQHTPLPIWQAVNTRLCP